MIDQSRDEISRFCALLPMSSGVPISREDVAELTTRPREDEIQVWRLIVLDEEDWVFLRADVRAHPRAKRRPLVTPVPSHAAPISARDMDASIARAASEGRSPIAPVGHLLQLEVGIEGSRPQAKFVSAAVGIATRSSAHPVSILPEDRVTLRGESQSLASADQPVSLHLSLEAPSVVESILIDDARDWIVEDVQLDRRRWTIQEGEFPAQALSAARDLELSIGTCLAIDIRARYVGADPSGQPLRCQVLAVPVRGRN